MDATEKLIKEFNDCYSNGQGVIESIFELTVKKWELVQSEGGAPNLKDRAMDLDKGHPGEVLQDKKEDLEIIIGILEKVNQINDALKKLFEKEISFEQDEIETLKSAAIGLEERKEDLVAYYRQHPTRFSLKDTEKAILSGEGSLSAIDAAERESLLKVISGVRSVHASVAQFAKAILSELQSGLETLDSAKRISAALKRSTKESGDDIRKIKLGVEAILTGILNEKEFSDKLDQSELVYKKCVSQFRESEDRRELLVDEARRDPSIVDDKRLRVLLTPCSAGFGPVSIAVSLAATCNTAKQLVSEVAILASEEVCNVVKRAYPKIKRYVLPPGGVVIHQLGDHKGWIEASSTYKEEMDSVLENFKPNLVIGSMHNMGVAIAALYGIKAVQIDNFFPELDTYPQSQAWGAKLLEVFRKVREIPTPRNREYFENELVKSDLGSRQWISAVVSDYLIVPEIYPIEVTRSVVEARVNTNIIKVGPLMNSTLQDILMDISGISKRQGAIIQTYRKRAKLSTDYTKTVLIVTGGVHDIDKNTGYWGTTVKAVSSVVRGLVEFNKQYPERKTNVVLVGRLIHDVETKKEAQEGWDEEMKDLVATPGIVNFKNALKLFAFCDLVVCNAGHTTLSELISINKPCLILPYADSEMERNTVEAEKNRIGISMAGLVSGDGQSTEKLIQAFDSLLNPESSEFRKLIEGQQAVLSKYQSTDELMLTLFGALVHYPQDKLSVMLSQSRELTKSIFLRSKQDISKRPTKPIRVLMISPSYGISNGVAEVVKHLSRCLLENGVGVDVLAHWFGEPFYYYDNPLDTGTATATYGPEDWQGFLNSKPNDYYDIIHGHSFVDAQAHDWPDKKIPWKDITNHFRNAKTLFHVHSLDLHEAVASKWNQELANYHSWVGNTLQPIMFDSVDLIIQITRTFLDLAEEMYPKKNYKAKSVVIPNAIDLREVTIVPKPSSEEIVLLYVGRMERRKGMGELSVAFGQLSRRYPNLRLHFMGGSDNKEYKKESVDWEIAIMKKLLLGSGIKQEDISHGDHPPEKYKVHFFGFQMGQAKEEVFNNADFVIIPSYFETFCLVGIEAIAYKKPLISSRGPALNEIYIESGLAYPIDVGETRYKGFDENGSLVNIADAQEFFDLRANKIVAAVSFCIEHRDACKARAEKAYEAVFTKLGEKFRWESIARVTRELYLSLLERNPAGEQQFMISMDEGMLPAIPDYTREGNERLLILGHTRGNIGEETETKKTVEVVRSCGTTVEAIDLFDIARIEQYERIMAECDEALRGGRFRGYPEGNEDALSVYEGIKRLKNSDSDVAMVLSWPAMVNAMVESGVVRQFPTIASYDMNEYTDSSPTAVYEKAEVIRCARMLSLLNGLKHGFPKDRTILIPLFYPKEIDEINTWSDEKVKQAKRDYIRLVADKMGKPVEIPENPILISAISLIIPRYNTDYVLDYMREIARENPNVFLLIRGKFDPNHSENQVDSEFVRRFEEFSQEVANENWFLWDKERLPDINDVFKIYKYCDIALCMNKFGHGNASIEHGALSVPQVLLKNNTNLSSFKDSAVFVESVGERNPEKANFIWTVRSLIDHEDYRRGYGEAVRKDVEKKFSHTIFAKKMILAIGAAKAFRSGNREERMQYKESIRKQLEFDLRLFGFGEELPDEPPESPGPEPEHSESPIKYPELDTHHPEFTPEVLAKYAAWNKKWDAPFGGMFANQDNNGTRAFEYPWAFYATPLQQGMKVLDFGGSLGGFQFVLDKEGAEVHTVDPGEEAKGKGWPVNQESMDRLNALYKTQVTLHNCFIEEAKLPPYSFDRVFSISVIEHIPGEHIRSAVKEIANALKPGGYFIATIDLFLDIHPFTEKTSNHFGTNIDIKRLVQESGLTLEYGNKNELYGYDEFDKNKALHGKVVVIGDKPEVRTQLIVLRKG